MVNLITELSKYLIILLMAGYTYYNFRYFKMKTADGKNRMCKKQNQLLFLIHALAFLLMYLRTENLEILKFYGMQLVFFVGYLTAYRLAYKNCSRLLLNNACVLLAIGFIMLTRLSFDKANKQFLIVVLSSLATIAVPYLIKKWKGLEKLSWIYGGIGLALLLVVLLIGSTSYGAQISLSFHGFSIQPSEFVKLSFIFFAAAMLSRSLELKNIIITTAAAGLHIVILVLSKDLGSALIFFIAYISMLFVATGKYLYFFGGLLSGSAAAAIAYRLFSHVRVRVEAWKDPWADIYNKGYQISQSLFAIGTGGWFGMGLFQGMPGKIPVVEKDFIFAAISEELGGIFGLCLIFVSMGCFLQFLLISADSKKVFYKLVSFGLGCIYVIQVVLTIGGTIKFIPLTGVTLPFVSYGGSSALSTFIIFGILQGIYMLNKGEEGENESKKIKSK